MTAFVALLFAFFVQGFCDIVGIASDYARNAFGWSLTVAGFVPLLVFVWFLFLSIPVGVKVNSWGRKNTVMAGMLVTLVGMTVPLARTGWACMAGFALLGIGNVILQVSQNVLLRNVIRSGRYFTSAVTAGQVAKAVSSFCGPLFILAAIHVVGSGKAEDWYLVFPLLGIITLISGAALYFSPFGREGEREAGASVGNTVALLGNKTLLMLFAGMFFVVAADVGANFISSKIMIQRYGWSLDDAGQAQQVYYICRTLGALMGIFVMTRVPLVLYFRYNVSACAAVLLLLALCRFDSATTLALIGAVGFLCSCLFPIVYTKALDASPGRANSVTGLMITAVSGGGIVTPVIGWLVDTAGTLSAGISVLLCCIFYLVGCAFRMKGEKNDTTFFSKKLNSNQYEAYV